MAVAGGMVLLGIADGLVGVGSCGELVNMIMAMVIILVTMLVTWGGSMVETVRDGYRMACSMVTAERAHRLPALDVMAHRVPHLAVHKAVQHRYRQTLKWPNYYSLAIINSIY